MVNIFFGNVVDVKDEEKIFRVKATIAGYTDKIAVEDLPWYYPFFGFHYIPIVDDVIPIFIFDGNFTTGFYNKKIDLESTGLDGSEYENYLEIYKRLGVELSYKESVGIQLINANSRLQIEELRASMYVKNNQITLDSLESSEAEEICPICHEGRIEEIGGCSTCTNCKVQLKCGL